MKRVEPRPPGRFFQPGGGIIAAREEGLHADRHAVLCGEQRDRVGDVVLLCFAWSGKTEARGEIGVAGEEFPFPRGGFAVGGFLGRGDLDDLHHAVARGEGTEPQFAEVGGDGAGDFRVPEILAQRAVQDFSGGPQGHAADVEAGEIPHHGRARARPSRFCGPGPCGGR